MNICRECSKEKGLVPKDKIVGTYNDNCDTCGEFKTVRDEHHDYEQNKE